MRSVDWPHHTLRVGSGRGALPALVPDRDACSLLIVTATTPHGVIAGHPFWPLLLDGILCMVERQIIRGVRPGVHDRHRSNLPLMACKPGSQGKQFSWCASAAMWPADTPVEPQPWGRRTDIPFHRAHGHAGRINISTGPDKSLWTSDEVTLTGVVTWRAVGVAAVVSDWLHKVKWIGAKSRRGNGKVTAWNVDAMPIPDGWSKTDIMKWVAEDPRRWSRVNRPLHPAWAPLIGHDGDTTLGAYRPPYVPPTQSSIGRLHEVEVLAP